MQPGQFNPKGEDWIGRELAELRRELRELKAANPYAPMGMRPMEGGVEFTGDMKVAGTLDLPSGIIGNDALSSPVTGAVVSGEANGFPVPGGSSGMATVITKTITVPEGFTKALVIANADMTSANSTAVADYVFIRLRVEGQGPTYIPGGYTPAGAVGFVSSSYSRLLEGLGGSFTITVEAGSGIASWDANPDDNTGNLNALITFLR